MSEQITVRISSGELAGVRADGIDRYLGIPYAAAPVGDRRFAEPEPAASWSGTRDATRMGPTAPQNPMSPTTARYLANVIAPGDECLNVNVWTPAGASARPVMVWIHGGSFRHGSNALDGYDGSAFARDGVVLVSVNYRLGVEGFSVLDDAPLSLGYSDVVAALRWVQREITAFGGDPGAVTIFGESAGGVTVSNLLAGPHAGTLFHRVIAQSGMPSAQNRKSAAKVTREAAKRLGIPTTRAAFAAVPVERLLEVDREMAQGGSALNVGSGYSPTIGSADLPRDPQEAALTGAGDDIPLLVGWTAEEHRLFNADGGFDRVGPLLSALVRLRMGAGRRVRKAYRAAYPDAGSGDLLATMMIDRILRIPVHRIADARLARGAASTHVFEFQWRSPVDGLGAAHVMELPFVFDRLSSPDWIKLAGPDAPQRIADEMHGAWIRFATTGDPGWPSWDAARSTMVFRDPVSEVQAGPRDAQLAAWRKRESDRRG
ncbi:carboxylesterase/lipase family protein [Kutzneria sp. CA-103260]|uniref:carboxylesterase/lipase family protein n=1 Tax=Kutzneria sp. CA-103260 TaxID=2802641 RepID=UPI001BAB5A17|nr:carboxylesterase family protein [Kutzneria sp. CA-103260]QUQ64141.1 carboxylesterase [Kutzneria sp. CA-103260]